MTGTPNGAPAPDDDGGGIPADLLADGQVSVAAPDEAEANARKVEQELADLRAQNRALQDRVFDQDRRHREQSDRLTEVLERTRAIDSRSSQAEDRGWEMARDDLKARIVRASQDGDATLVANLMADLDLIDKHRPKVDAKPPKKDDSPANPPAAPDPAVTEWVAANPWFNTDEELHDYAVSRDNAMARANPAMPMRERLAKVREQTVKRFSEKFPTEVRRDAAAAVSRPGAQVAKSRPKGKTEADLPQSARDAMERFVRQGVLTKEQYLKDYQWDSKD